MKLGFAFSPGGLLLPYHLGVLECLSYNKILQDSTPIAGSSAGGIAVVSYGCGLDTKSVLESTIRISDECERQGGARGRLLKLLNGELEHQIQEKELLTLQSREAVGVAYREVFPRPRNILQTSFKDKADVINAVCNSSMFPFFATNFPCRFDLPSRRLAVDGFFAVPRDRFGCPDFQDAGLSVDRTIFVSCFPQESIRLNAAAVENCISPLKEENKMENLGRLALESSSRSELIEVYANGYKDTERWMQQYLDLN